MDRRDVLEEILVRLPAKSLIRFRSVSKSWNSIITDPHFITKHFKRNLNQSESLISPNTHSGYLLYTTWDWNRSPSSKHLCTVACDSDGTLTPISRFEIPSTFEGYRIVGFCNGLFCLASSSFDPNHILYLWNPSIRMKKRLATLSTDEVKNSVVGIAYNSQNNGFKILRLLTVWEGPAEALIYSLSTDSDSCRKVVISMESLGTIDAFKPPCIFFNGALHALASASTFGDSYRDDSYLFILSFDVNDDSYREIKLPFNYSSVDSCQLALFNGSLAVFGRTFGMGQVVWKIWVLERYGAPNPWTRKYTVPTVFGDLYGRPGNGELLMERGTELSLYDPESKKRNILAIKNADWVSFTADSMESSFYSMALHLEDLAEKDGTEKSDAAKRALDSKKSVRRGSDNSRHTHEKTEDKRKKKEYWKSKDSKLQSDAAKRALDSKKSVRRGSDNSRHTHEKTEDKRKNKEYWKSKDSKDHSVEKDGLPNNLENMLLNGSPVSMRSSDVSGAKKMSGTNDAMAKQANGGISEDGFLPSDRRTGRKGKRQKSSSKFFNGKCQTMTSEKESNDVGSPHIEGHLKEQDIFLETPGTDSGGPLLLENGTKTLRLLHVEDEEEERFQADLKKAVRQSLGNSLNGATTQELEWR